MQQSRIFITIPTKHFNDINLTLGSKLKFLISLDEQFTPLKGSWN